MFFFAREENGPRYPAVPRIRPHRAKGYLTGPDRGRSQCPALVIRTPPAAAQSNAARIYKSLRRVAGYNLAVCAADNNLLGSGILNSVTDSGGK